MTYQPFVEKFEITANIAIENENSSYKSFPTSLLSLFEQFGGATFNKGLYRVHSFRTSIQWSILIAEAFPLYLNKIYPFGFDWMGRHFCQSIDSETIFVFDPGTLEVFETHRTLEQLHNVDFTNEADDLLSSNLFKLVLDSKTIDEVQFGQCIGYKLPLFLGGKDVISNYDVQDMEVYWHFQNKLYEKVKDLPDGTKIRRIKFR